MKVFLMVFLLRLLLFTGCTTVRPLTAREIKQARLIDTMQAPVPFSGPVKVVEVHSMQRDTVYSEKLTRVETLAPNDHLDAEILAVFLHQHDVAVQTEMASLKAAIESLQFMILRNKKTDSALVVMQMEWNVTKREQNVAKETIATNNKIIYDSPKYIYFGLITLIVLLFLVYHFLKRRLKQKILSS
jgi:hypothetical protein